MATTAHYGLRLTALLGLMAGAAGSLAFMLHAGRRNNSKLLMFIMAIWVLSPFMVLFAASLVSKYWQPATRKLLAGGMIILSLGSLAVYIVDAMRQPKPQAAFVFIVFPPISWVLIAIAGIAIKLRR